MRDVRAIAAELRKYDEKLYRKPRWLVLNKIDLVPPGERKTLLDEFRRRLRTKAPIFSVSAATGEGCRELMSAVARFLSTHRAEHATEDGDADARFSEDAEREGRRMTSVDCRRSPRRCEDRQQLGHCRGPGT